MNMRPSRATRRKWRIPDEKGQRVDCFHVRNSKDGSPCLSQLRTDRLAPLSKFDYVLTHMRFMGFHKLSNFDGHRVG
jgi:hypothetical protein